MREMRGGTRPRFRALALAAALLAAGARADEVEYSIYRVDDARDTRVVTSSFSVAKTLVRRTLLLLDVELDQTAIAPLDGVDAISGASRPSRNALREFRKSRGQIIAGLEQGLGADTRVSASYYFSQEIDYRSQSAVGTLTRELFQKNLTLDLRARYSLDSVGEITDANDLVNRFKEVHQVSLTATQLLSPTAFLRLGADGQRDHGYLGNPYRYVRAAGSADLIRENHPAERWRQAAWGELSKYLKGMEGSLVLHYLYCWDDWSIEGHTAQLTLNKYVTPDWVLSPEYRYHHQTGAFFQEQPGKDGYHTADWKLMPQDAHTFGLEATWYLRSLGRRRPGLEFLNGMSLAVHYFHYFSDTHRERFTSDAWQTRIRFDY